MAKKGSLQPSALPLSYQGQKVSPDLVDGDHSIPDVVEGDLAIPIHIQNVKGLLGFLRLQEMLQVLRQYVCSAKQQSVMQRKEKRKSLHFSAIMKGAS